MPFLYKQEMNVKWVPIERPSHVQELVQAHSNGTISIVLSDSHNVYDWKYVFSNRTNDTRFKHGKIWAERKR